ncbi:uncharacterized protein LOC130082726 isoform X2 [Rhinichthys klamathensis goyatoka]|uniref:uncharacterized protein LOC130082726 isoform X2 n=1 Tax=Rhinichthys klamathensis goyatoka TaxID=3034132 RepID=UPI0024B547CD|nr:uncharacterized protein LOC130082726 isoform X2 [Rhinichthys klamathensis goyatoka]
MKSNNSLIHHSCKEHIRFIPKTEEMSFEVSNLQINDTGTYICVVTRTIPPPSELLGEERTFVQVIEQVWMRNGGFQNVSLTYNINKTNPDESFTLHSYLKVSDCTNYSCWVNHSSLSQPMILHLPPADCYENRGRFRVLFISALLTLVLLIIAVMCCPWRSCQQPVEVSVPSELILHSELKTEVVYSVLSDHHPANSHLHNTDLLFQ